MHHNLRSPEHRPSVPQMAENVDECTTECHDNLEVQIYGLWDCKSPKFQSLTCHVLTSLLSGNLPKQCSELLGGYCGDVL